MLKKPSIIVLFSCKLICLGGAERLMLEEAKYFSGRKTKVKILTFQFKEEALFGESGLDVEVISCGNPLLRILKLRNKLKYIAPDLVIAQSFEDSNFLYLATLFSSIKYITHIHGTMFWFDNEYKKYALIHRKVFTEIRNSIIGHREFIPESAKLSLLVFLKINLVALLDYLAVRKALGIITLSEHLKWEIRKLYNRDAVIARGCLSPRLLNYKLYENIKDKLGIAQKRVILSVGRLDHRKRTDIIIKAFSRLTIKYPDIILFIVGTGEEEERLKNLSRELNLEEKVLFFGLVSEDKLFDFYSACEVFVFLAWCGFGIVRYEALAFNKKAVWTSEIEESETKLWPRRVFVSEPTTESLEQNLKSALDVAALEKIDFSLYLWERYFDKVYEVVSAAIKNKET